MRNETKNEKDNFVMVIWNEKKGHKKDQEKHLEFNPPKTEQPLKKKEKKNIQDKEKEKGEYPIGLLIRKNPETKGAY